MRIRRVKCGELERTLLKNSMEMASHHFTRRILMILGRIYMIKYTENDGANHLEIPPSYF